MKNILKVQLFQLKKEKAVPVLLISGLLLSLASALLLAEEQSRMNIQMKGSLYVIGGLYVNAIIVVGITFLQTAYIVCKDFGDKTICYEIQSGYERKSILLGRVAVAMVLCLFVAVLCMVVPVTVISARYGYGNYVAVQSLVIRLLIFLIIVFRLISEIVLISVIIKKTHFAYMAGFIIGMLEMGISSETEYPYITIFNSIYALFEFDTKGFLHIDGRFDFTVAAALSAEVYVPVIVASLLIGGICLAGAYVFFKDDDV